MSNIDQILAAGEMLARSFIEARKARGERTSPSIVASHLEDNFDAVFSFDRADVGSYVTAFPDIWSAELIKDLETTLRRAVSSALQRRILQSIDITLFSDLLSELEERQGFRAAVISNVESVVELVKKSGYSPIRTSRFTENRDNPQPQGIDQLTRMTHALCLRILQSNEPNDYRLLTINLNKVGALGSDLPVSAGAVELLATTAKLATCADLIARGVVPLPIVNQRWEDDRQRNAKKREDDAERQAEAERERIAGPAVAYLEAFPERYGMAALDFVAVKESLQDAYGLRSGAITQVMLDHFALDYCLWEDGFKTVSTRVNGAIKAAGAHKGAPLSRDDLDPLVNASLGATAGLKKLEHVPVVRNPEIVNFKLG